VSIERLELVDVEDRLVVTQAEICHLSRLIEPKNIQSTRTDGELITVKLHEMIRLDTSRAREKKDSIRINRLVIKIQCGAKWNLIDMKLLIEEYIDNPMGLPLLLDAFL
jgi:hypothetical protein